MKLKVSEESVFKVNYYDVEKLIGETYGREYNLPDDMESNNDTSLEILVDGILGEYSFNTITKWVETGKGNCLLRSLMNDLCRIGAIDKGRYLIRISW